MSGLVSYSVLGGLALALGALATASTNTTARVNPYQIIAERNAFGLKAYVPPPPPPAGATATELPDLKLSGIATLESKKWAFLVLESQRGNPQFLGLSEGQKDGEFEVLEIDAEDEKVRVRHRDSDLWLSFKTHRFKGLTPDQRAEQKFVADHIRAHELRQHQEREREERERAAAHPSSEPSARTAAFSPDGRQIVTTTTNGTARLWDSRTGVPLPND